MPIKKIILVSGLLLLFAAFYGLEFDQYIELNVLKQKSAELIAYYETNPWQASGWFFLVYVISSAVSIPGASILTLAGGAIFGFGWGLLLVSFASTLGASLAFLLSRYVLSDWVQSRFSSRLADINAGVKKEGAFYLFGLRLIVVFPFWLINLLMGLTPIKLRTYFWVSQLGMFPATALFVNAGTQLVTVDQLSDILSPSVAISFALLGLLPLIAKPILAAIARYQSLQGYTKPDQFDYNLIVIGAGAAGLVSSYIAAAVKAKVLLIEKHKMGGDCLNTGCVPSKSLIQSTRFLADLSRSKKYGINHASAEFDFAEVMQRAADVITKIEPHDSVERYQQLGVECVQAEARVISPWEVEFAGKKVTARRIIIATGATPRVPAIKGIEQVSFYTSDTIWSLRTRPERLLVVGGGPIGCELSQAFNRLGCKVTLIDLSERLLETEEEQASALLMTQFESEGIELKLQHSLESFSVEAGETYAKIKAQQGASLTLKFDAVLFAIGRQANTKNMGLEQLGVNITASGNIAVDQYMRSSVPTLYACGDVAGPYQFTHTAAHYAWYSTVNSLFSDLWHFKADHRVIPRVTFCQPEIASVGFNEESAKEAGLVTETTIFKLDELDRAIIDGKTSGYIKVLTPVANDKILGVTIVGEHAGDLLPEFVLAMKHGLGLNKILATIHAYPTWAEANKYTAGVWKKNHQPKRLLNFLARYHAAKRE